MLYSIILPILAPYGDMDFCASDRWSFAGSVLLDVKACTVCIAESITKIVIIDNTSIGFESSL